MFAKNKKISCSDQVHLIMSMILVKLKILKRQMQLVCDIIEVTWKIRSFKLSIEIDLFLQLALKYYSVVLHLFINNVYSTRFGFVL